MKMTYENCKDYNKYLFVVCMNGSGSTLLHYYLEKCDAVASLPRIEPDIATSSEGQNHVREFLPLPEQYDCVGVFTESSDVFGDDSQYNWDEIKKIWHREWASSASTSLDNLVLLEKSPPNVVRAELLQKHFPNSYFIVMVRNPYAFSEGLRRRHGPKIEPCATHWGESMKFQIRNLEILNNVVCIKYEDLCDNQELVKTKIKALLPELDDLSFEGDFSGHHSLYGKKEMPIRNLNSDQIGNLGTNDIIRINNILSEYQEELTYFDYKMMP